MARWEELGGWLALAVAIGVAWLGVGGEGDWAGMRKFARVVEDYLGDLRRIRVSGGATGERSGYRPLVNLLNEIGGGLRAECGRGRGLVVV